VSLEPSVAQRVLELLRQAARPMSAAELYELTGKSFQHINGTLRALAREGQILQEGNRGSLHYLLNPEASPRARRQPGVSTAFLIGEDDVKHAVKLHLEAQGYTVTTMPGSQHGIDIQATRGDEAIHLEAKGEGASDAHQQNNFTYAVGELIINHREGVQEGFALPDNPKNRGLVARLPEDVCKLGKLVVYWVQREAGGFRVSEVQPLHRIAVGLPPDRSLPYLSYGLFKPGEFGFASIDKFLAATPSKVPIEGGLWTRDGLPLLKLGQGSTEGFRLDFRPEDAEAAYSVIGAFEPRSQYRWATMPIDGQQANVLVGHQLEQGAMEFEEQRWTYRTDPVFLYVPAVIKRGLQDDGSSDFLDYSMSQEIWPRLFRLEMHYLLLWTLLERFISLRSGPLLEPGEKVRRLGEYGEFRDAFEKRVPTVDGRTGKILIYDSRGSGKARLTPGDSARSAKYYYLVRNNVAHRGKGAWNDGEIVRCSLRELHAITVDMLVAVGIEPETE
jgi:hypothetical protein